MSEFTASSTLEAAALAKTALGDWVSLHTGNPGRTGTDEAVGGSPAYARQKTTWAGGSTDGVVPGTEVSIDAPAGIYTHFGIWSSAFGGTYIDGGEFDTPVELVAQDDVLVAPTMSET